MSFFIKNKLHMDFFFFFSTREKVFFNSVFYELFKVLSCQQCVCGHKDRIMTHSGGRSRKIPEEAAAWFGTEVGAVQRRGVAGRHISMDSRDAQKYKPHQGVEIKLKRI